MATVSTYAHVSKIPFNSLTSSFALPVYFTSKSKSPPQVRCALSPSEWRESRRLVSISLAVSHLMLFSNSAAAGSILDKYVKRKKLEPLEVYVPAIILTQLQIKDLEKTLEDDKPEFAACRSLLRSGPAASLRVNIRAVAQYASDSGNGRIASNNVDQCLSLLQTVPSDVLSKGKNVADSYRMPEDVESERLDPELKQLESIL
ncbi:Apicidin F synthase [Quillaja saponaria]|uniref:Apicidin F synthase n=1 Tax=Quillaja saponaria TaxID=32244 RepID=A0AAD7PTB1_QUISA|nr:Apicidin F synthase [Quillaja saponaria]